MAEFSKVTIEFLVNFQFDFEVTLSTTLNDNLTSKTWEWVTTRSAPYEVTTGLPSGILGERAAINFASAYILDEPDDYIVNQTTNNVEIISETEGLDFVGFTGLGIFGRLLIEGVHYNITFENYVAPPLT